MIIVFIVMFSFHHLLIKIKESSQCGCDDFWHLHRDVNSISIEVTVSGGVDAHQIQRWLEVIMKHKCIKKSENEYIFQAAITYLITTHSAEHITCI